MVKGKIAHTDQMNTIADVHRLLGLPGPLHPLISLINNTNNQVDLRKLPQPHVLKFYKISFKTRLSGKLKYGQGYYDFDDGGMMFASPNQVLSLHGEPGEHAGYTLLIHPDFLLGHPLAKKTRQYGFFSYSANEALHVSEKEMTVILSVFRIMEEEMNSRIDDFSQNVMIAQIELLLNYAERFYRRQFITGKMLSNDLLQKLEDLLEEYFSDEKSLNQGIPTVQHFAGRLNLSAGYLSDMLRLLTGQNVQQLIHHRIIEKAKEILSSSNLSVSEIAYQLGFEHPQSFSRMFKSKTNISPLAFRKSFNSTRFV